MNGKRSRRLLTLILATLLAAAPPGIAAAITSADDEVPLAHKECVQNPGGGLSVCQAIEGDGEDQCLGDEDCNHRGCLDDPLGRRLSQCALSPGSGPDTCDANDDCNRKVCSQALDNRPIICGLEPGQGPDECDTALDCPSHRICSGYQSTIPPECRTFLGPGTDECQSNDDCESHMACSYLGIAQPTCIHVEGEGDDECSLPDSNDPDDPPVGCPFHKDCISNPLPPPGPSALCGYSPGEGQDRCVDHPDCNDGHRVCIVNETSSDPDWVPSPPVCGFSEVAGSDSCSSDQDCPYHRICTLRILADDEVPAIPVCSYTNGAGEDECSEDTDCSSTAASRPAVPAVPQQRQLQLDAPPSTAPNLLLASTQSIGNAVGRSKAPVTVEVYYDIRCGVFKRWFLRELPYLLEQEVKRGFVKVVFRDFPLSDKQNERGLMLAARCAGTQHLLLPFMELVLRSKESTPDAILRYSESIKADVDKMSRCLADPATKNAYKRDLALGRERGVQGTPTLFINGEKFAGAHPYARIAKTVKELIKKNRKVEGDISSMASNSEL